jgi:NADH-quinone oxidoreductase subunit F
MSRKLLLENAHIPGIGGYDVYRQHGGYRSVEKALKTMSPDTVLDEVKKSGLRGRGGAGFPTGMKWSFLAKPEGVPRYLLCNADESEPGTFKDRFLMEKIPHLLIEGMIVSSFALGANTSYIYIRGEYSWIVFILEKAIAEAYAKGWLGKNIQGSGFDLDLYVNPGAGAYICGEETALIESLEGKRGNPRIKPPFPAVRGLWQSPTVVNNVETIAAVVPIIIDGGDEYAKIGVGKSTGTKLISAGGNINKPGVYEIDLGLPVEEFIYSDEVVRRHQKRQTPQGLCARAAPRCLFCRISWSPKRRQRRRPLDDLRKPRTAALPRAPCSAPAALSCTTKTSASCATPGTLPAFITMNPAASVRPAAKAPAGWKKCSGVWKTGRAK